MTDISIMLSHVKYAMIYINFRRFEKLANYSLCTYPIKSWAHSSEPRGCLVKVIDNEF